MSKRNNKNGSSSVPNFDLGKMFLMFSCLQKAIRRGQEEEAYFWACELMSIGKGGETALWNRLRIIASEDVGLVANAAVVVNNLSKSAEELKKEGEGISEELKDEDADLFSPAEVIDNLAELYKRMNNHGRMLFVSHAILYLCRSYKNREVDDFIAHMNGRMKEGWKPEIPDYAFDKHTREGRKKERGFKHFYDGDKEDHSDSPTHLENVKGGSKYLESARKYDLASEKKEGEK